MIQKKRRKNLYSAIARALFKSDPQVKTSKTEQHKNKSRFLLLTLPKKIQVHCFLMLLNRKKSLHCSEVPPQMLKNQNLCFQVLHKKVKNHPIVPGEELFSKHELKDFEKDDPKE